MKILMTTLLITTLLAPMAHVLAADDSKETKRDNATASKAAAPRTAWEIRFGPVDPEEGNRMQEDLQIMALVIEKKLEPFLDRDPRTFKMGIPMLLLPSSRPVQGMYLEGFGALFTLDVSFPLLPSSAKPRPSQTSAPNSTDWEQARRQLFGDADEKEPSASKQAGGRAEFDARKVEELKHRLTEALREAANMGALKADESIAVVVSGSSAEDSPAGGGFGSGGFGGGGFAGGIGGSGFGGGGAGGRLGLGHTGAAGEVGIGGFFPERGSSNDEGAGRAAGGGGGFAGGGGFILGGLGTDISQFGNGQMSLGMIGGVAMRRSDYSTVLTLRAKKKDLEAFARGELSLDELREKTASHAYIGFRGEQSSNPRRGERNFFQFLESRTQ